MIATCNPSEAELADRVREAVRALNNAVVGAKLAGLHVTLEVRSRTDMGEKYARHSVEADILKVL